MAYQKYINNKTVTRTNYHSQLNANRLDRLFRLKNFASHKVVTCRNKASMALHNARSTTAAFWIAVFNPIRVAVNFVVMYFIQGILYITAIPFVRIQIAITEFLSKK